MSSRPYHSSRNINNKRRSPTSQISQTSKRIIDRHSNNTKEFSPSNQSENAPKYKKRSNINITHNKKRYNAKLAKHQKRSGKHSKSAALRRKQRDINYQYKLYSLREIISKITTKSSIISTNTAKETLITYYQTFTTSQELLDELEHRFFSVLPIEEEDKSARPYISDTDSVSERHFKFGSSNNHSYTPRPHIYHINTGRGSNNKNIQMDENKAYCIQVRVINLLTFWMKEYFMEDFNEVNMLQQLKNFIRKIKNLKQKQKLPSIPFDDETPIIVNTATSDVPPIPDINDNDNTMYHKLINQNKTNDIIIKTTPTHSNTPQCNRHRRLGTNDGISPVDTQQFKQPSVIRSYQMERINNNNNNNNNNLTMNRNPLHPSHNVNTHSISNIHNSITTPNHKAIANIISDGQNSQNSATMKTEQMEQITNKIHPIHQVSQDTKHCMEHKEQYYVVNELKEEKEPNDYMNNHMNNMNNMFMLNPNDNTIYIPSDELCRYNNTIHVAHINGQINADLFYIINGIDNIKVMIRNICDYNNMHNHIGIMNGKKHNNAILQVDEKEKEKEKEKCVKQLQEKPQIFKRHKNINMSKRSEDSDDKNNQSKELTENIVTTPMTSSTDARENSMTSFNKIDDSRITVTVDDPIYSIAMDDDNNNNNNTNNNNTNNNNNNNNTAIIPNGNNIIRRYYVSDPIKYKSLADKIEKTLNKQKKEAPKSSDYINKSMSQRCLFGGAGSDKKKKKHTPVTAMAQLGCSVRGSAKIRGMFEDEILPLKEDFQNKVKNKVIAEQITLMTFNAFKRVRKREFIDQAWKCKDRLELAGNLCQLIDHFNCISRWVQITILHCKDVKKRGRMIKKFIKIMDLLLELNNFQSLCAVYGAITSSSIYSLENAWEFVPGKHKERFEHIKHYFVTANNMANLRNLHKERNPPMIPYTGIYLQDLIQTEERFKERMIREQMKNNNNHNNNNIKYDFTGSGGVVFDHLTKMSKQIDNILVYAKTPYHNIKDDQIIQKYVLSEFAQHANLTEDQIYKLSETVSKTDAQR